MLDVRCTCIYNFVICADSININFKNNIRKKSFTELKYLKTVKMKALFFIVLEGNWERLNFIVLIDTLLSLITFINSVLK